MTCPVMQEHTCGVPFNPTHSVFGSKTKPYEKGGEVDRETLSEAANAHPYD